MLDGTWLTGTGRSGSSRSTSLWRGYGRIGWVPGCDGLVDLLRRVAVVFGGWFATAHGGEFGAENFAGYIVEKSPSVDSLFVLSSP